MGPESAGRAARPAPTLGALEDQLDKLHGNLRDVARIASGIRARLNGPWPEPETGPGTPPSAGIVERLMETAETCLKLTAETSEQLAHIGVGVGPLGDGVPTERLRR